MSKGLLEHGFWASLVVASIGATLLGVTTGCTTAACKSKCKGELTHMDNTKFYKNNTLDDKKAKQAYFDLMKKFNVPVYAELQREDGPFWAVDFGKGEFASFGMGGVFWCNEGEGYFGHEIYLLPGQNVPEHRHLPTKDAAGNVIKPKIESWQVRYGYVYGFSEVGEPNLDQYPEAKAMLAKLQIPYLKCVHVEKWEADGKVHKLAGPETWHFMQAGKDGAIVTEYATFHDNDGLRFTVPGSSL